MSKTALTYHNDPKFKSDFVAMTRLHREQDRYVRGQYHSGTEADFHGCSVGCSVRSLKLLGRNHLDYNDHAKLGASLGWPEWLTLLQDTIFENLPDGDREKWTEELADAVPVGVSIGRVKWQFCAFLMRENIERVLALQIDDALKKQVVDSVRAVLKLHEDAALTGIFDESAAWSARSAAWSARSAAWSAWSARSAAWSARSAAESAAKFVIYKNELLRLLREAKP